MKHCILALGLTACTVDVSYLTGPQSYSCDAAEKCPGGKVCVQGLCCASACSRDNESTCAQSGQCKADGTGCALYDDSIVCAPASCSNGQLTPAATCNGQGVCQPETTTACPGNLGCADATSCKTTCTSSADDCVNGTFCQADGTCQHGTQPSGLSCNEATDCASGHCVNNICCQTACTDQGAASCGDNGFCQTDGPDKGQCALYPANTACRASVCNNVDGVGQYIAPQTCAGDGSACPQPTTTQACDGDAACSSPTDCTGACTPGTQTGCADPAWCRTDYCGSSNCLPKCLSGEQLNGDSCNNPSDCVNSGYCNQHVCCTSGQCCKDLTACPSSTGCTSQAQCTGENYSCTNFACAASSPCAGTATAGGDCGAYKLNTCPTVCGAGCSQDADCATGYYCDGAACQPKTADGSSCSIASPHSCTSGYCSNSDLRMRQRAIVATTRVSALRRVGPATARTRAVATAMIRCVPITFAAASRTPTIAAARGRPPAETVSTARRSIPAATMRCLAMGLQNEFERPIQLRRSQLL